MTTDGEKLDGVAPKPGYVTTRQAARLYGISTDAFLKAMAEDGPEPFIESFGFRRYWWNPVEVLQARAVRAERYAVGMKHKLRERIKRPRDYRGSTLKGKATFLEGHRLVILQRVAERKGTTVKELAIAKGLETWYASLPTNKRPV